MESAVIAFKNHPAVAVAFLLLMPWGFSEEKPSQNKYEASLNAWSLGDLDQARTLIEELLESDQRDAMAHAILGQVLDGQGDEESDSHLEQALELGGSDLAVLTRVGDCYATRFGSYFNSDLSYLAPVARRQAEELYLRWAEQQPESPLPIQRLAWIKQTAGDAEGAIGLLFVAICSDPMEDGPHGELWRFLGNGLDYEQLASFYEGLALTHKGADVKGRCLNYQGQVLIALGARLRSDAARTGEQAGEAERLNQLGEAQAAYNRAIPCLERSARVDPALDEAARWYVADSLVASAELFGDMGDLAATTRMIEDVRQAVLASAEPGSEGFKAQIDRLSFALFQASGGEGGSPEGMQTLADLWKWALTLVDDDVEWWNNYAFFCRESEQFEQSYEAYNRCLELDPESVRLTNDTGLIQLYHLRSDLDRALKLFEQAAALGEVQYVEDLEDEAQKTELRSAYGDALLNLGRLHTERGEYDLAGAAFDRLEELDGDRPDLLISKIGLLLEVGDTEKIRGYVYETAMKLLIDPDDRRPRLRLRMLGSAIESSLSEEDPDLELKALVELTNQIIAPPKERDAEAGEQSARRGRRRQ